MRHRRGWYSAAVLAQSEAVRETVTVPAPAPDRWVVFDPVSGSYLSAVGYRKGQGSVDVADARVYDTQASADWSRAMWWSDRASAFAMKLYSPSGQASDDDRRGVRPA